MKPVVTSVLKQGGIEGTEEMISEIAGNVADIVVTRESSGYKQYVAYLRSLGYSQKHAEEEATLQYFVYGTAMAGLGGALSGGVLGGGAVALGNLWNGAQVDAVPGLENLLPDGVDADKMDAALELWMGTGNNGKADTEIADPEAFDFWRKAFSGEIVTKRAGDVGKKTIVIGETMERVKKYASEIGAETYKEFKYYEKTKAMFGKKLADFIGGVDNALWLIGKMVQKYKIVDLGLDMKRLERSPYYLMESVLAYLYKYKDYAEDFMKGAF